MKKNVLKLTLLLIVAFFVSNANAQMIGLSLKGGMNFATLNGDEFKMRTGYHVGVGVELDLPFLIGINTGLNFTSKGTKYDANDDWSSNALYLEVPVYANYKLTVAPKTKLVFNLGPYFAYGIGGKTKIDGIKEDTFGDDGFKKFDFGFGGGVGLDVANILVNVGCQFGVTKTLDFDNKSKRTQNIMLGVGYRFFSL